MNISPEAEAKLRQKAQFRGVTLSELMEKFANDTLGEETHIPVNGAELIVLLQADGVLGAWADREDVGGSAEYARQLRRQAETRDRSS